MKGYIVQTLDGFEGMVVENQKVYTTYSAAREGFLAMIGKFFLECISDSQILENSTPSEGYSGRRNLSDFFNDLYNEGFYTESGNIKLPHMPPINEQDFCGYFNVGTTNYEFTLAEIEICGI